MRRLARALLLLLLPLSPAAAAAEIRVEDSRGRHVFAAPPGRVAALSWSLAEQVLELDAAPAAVADPQGCRSWVARPALPEGVADAGLRREPNLERLAELAPDAILISDDQIALAPALERVAPVLHFETFSEDHDNFRAARETYRTLARLLGREALAERRLAGLEARLAELRGALQARFDGAPPATAVVRLADDRRAVLHGAESMPGHALEALGVPNAVEIDASKWGIAYRPIRELAGLGEAQVLHIAPFAQSEALFGSALWQAMPFVRAGRFRTLPPVWTYGGAMSVGRLAEAIAAALLDAPR
jgi:iron complex transport system substrate-binding protein